MIYNLIFISLCNNRSEWRRGKALEFKTRERWFESRRQSLSFSHVDEGDAFQFINHMSQRGDKNQQVGVV